MKRLLVFQFLLLPTLAQAQKPDGVVLQMPYDTAAKAVVYTEVVHADSTPADQLYLRARAWFAETFRSADAVIQMDDKQSATIIGKGFSALTVNGVVLPAEAQLWYTVKVYAKDGRYKYEIDGLRARTREATLSGPPAGWIESDINGIVLVYRLGKARKWQIRQCNTYHAHMQGLIANLKKAMAKPAGTAMSDW